MQQARRTTRPLWGPRPRVETRDQTAPPAAWVPPPPRKRRRCREIRALSPTVLERLRRFYEERRSRADTPSSIFAN